MSYIYIIYAYLPIFAYAAYTYTMRVIAWYVHAHRGYSVLTQIHQLMSVMSTWGSGCQAEVGEFT